VPLRLVAIHDVIPPLSPPYDVALSQSGPSCDLRVMCADPPRAAVQRTSLDVAEVPDTVMGAAPKMGLRVPPGRPVVGIDEFAVEPPRVLMSTSERFLEIAHLHALLHYGPYFSHKPCNHPVRSIPSQNLVQFRNRLRFHDSLVPKLTDRRSDRGD